jgi:hypothetical protein
MPDSGFRFERDLVAVLEQNSAAALRIDSGGFRVLTEVQIGACIPDLLIVDGGNDDRRSSAPLSYFDCTLVAATIQAGVTTIDALADTTFSPTAEIARRVGRLVRLGLFAQCRDEGLRVTRRALPNRLRIIAVEAKLTRWKDALAQTKSYLSFANEAYIAMPAQAVRRNINALTACADAGIGVIGVDECDASVILPAEYRQPRSPEWVRVVSSAVSLPYASGKFSANASRQAR